MPIEAVSREEYLGMMDVKKIEINDGEIIIDCEAGGCPVR
jgi:hypothetical protein